MSYLINNNKKNQSLFEIAKETLTVSLLKLRISQSTTLKLQERIKICKGIELSFLIDSLPHSGLRPELLEYLVTNHPEIYPFLERFWKEICLKEFSRDQINTEESWRHVYLELRESSNSKMLEAGLRLRKSYKGEEKKLHQLKTISTVLSRKRPRFSITQGGIKRKPTSLMEKARSEAMLSATRTAKSPSKSIDRK